MRIYTIIDKSPDKLALLSSILNTKIEPKSLSSSLLSFFAISPKVLATRLELTDDMLLSIVDKSNLISLFNSMPV